MRVGGPVAKDLSPLLFDWVTPKKFEGIKRSLKKNRKKFEGRKISLKEEKKVSKKFERRKRVSTC